MGLDAGVYTRGEKVFGMEEIQLFAEALQPEYGLAIHNSLMANAKVFESSPTADSSHWLNILNLNEHFMPITSPTGFFGADYWCEQCNKVYAHKNKHQCIDKCQACKSINPQDCQFRLGKFDIAFYHGHIS